MQLATNISILPLTYEIKDRVVILMRYAGWIPPQGRGLIFWSNGNSFLVYTNAQLKRNETAILYEVRKIFLQRPHFFALQMNQHLVDLEHVLPKTSSCAMEEDTSCITC